MDTGLPSTSHGPCEVMVSAHPETPIHIPLSPSGLYVALGRDPTLQVAVYRFSVTSSRYRCPRCKKNNECGLHVQWLSPRRHTNTDIPNRYRFHFDFALGKLWFIVCVICHPFLLILLCLTHSQHSLKDRAARCYMFVRGNVRSCDQCGRRRRAEHWFGCGCLR